jgi:hypothetical protein
MKAIDIVKEKIVTGYVPAMKRQRVEGKIAYILQNPETLKWVAITDEQADELNNLHHIAKYGVSVNDDPFTFKS